MIPKDIKNDFVIYNRRQATKANNPTCFQSNFTFILQR